MDAVALICGLVWTNIAALIEVGISPTPAPSTPPSVLLLRALARLPHDGESIADMLMLATSIGVRPTELILLLRRSLDAGYLRDRPSGSLVLKVAIGDEEWDHWAVRSSLASRGAFPCRARRTIPCVL